MASADIAYLLAKENPTMKFTKCSDQIGFFDYLFNLKNGWCVQLCEYPGEFYVNLEPEIEYPVTPYIKDFCIFENEKKHCAAFHYESESRMSVLELVMKEVQYLNTL